MIENTMVITNERYMRKQVCRVLTCALIVMSLTTLLTMSCHKNTATTSGKEPSLQRIHQDGRNSTTESKPDTLISSDVTKKRPDHSHHTSRFPPTTPIANNHQPVDMDPQKDKTRSFHEMTNVLCARYFYASLSKHPNGIRSYKQRYAFMYRIIGNAINCFDHRRNLTKKLLLYTKPHIETGYYRPHLTTGQCHCIPPTDFPKKGHATKDTFHDCYPENPMIGQLSVDPKGTYGYYRSVLSYYVSLLESRGPDMLPVAQILWAFANSPGPMPDRQMRQDLAANKPRLGNPYVLTLDLNFAKETYASQCWHKEKS